MIRVVPFLVLAVVDVALLSWVVRWIQRAADRRPGRRGSRRVGGNEFDRHADQAKRRLKGVP